MDKKNFIILILVLVLGLLVVLLGVFIKNRNNDPLVVTKNFYNEWINTDKYSLDSQNYDNISVWTNNFKDKVQSIVGSFEKGGYDPILCAQDKPENFNVDLLEQQEGSTKVLVTQFFSGQPKTVEVILKKVGGQWLIDDVLCGGENISISVEIQNLVADYISSNISDLSPEKAVLGGTFYVTRIVFKDNIAGGTVEYEDGHIALVADFTFKVDLNGQVEISSFEILPEEELSKNFSEIGNLVKDEGADGWSLVYEKPGQPALRAILMFTENSQCLSVGQMISCNNFDSGDRVKIEGLNKINIVTVSTLELL